MNPRLGRAYVQNTIKASTPGQLVVMLYDGLLRFASDARDAMHEGKSSAHAIDRCIRIITELNLSLKFDVAPELCTQLSNLYEYYVVELSKSMQQNQPQIIDNLIPMITTLRDAWSEAEAQLAQKGS